jgi:penicillin-binding protein 1A
VSGRLLALGLVLTIAVGCSDGPATEDLDVSDVAALAEIDGLGDLRAGVASAGVDPEIQQALGVALRTHVPDTQGRFVAAAVVVDVASGRIVAYDTSATGRGDLLDQQRPSGSTLKLVVDAALADAGVNADDGVFVVNCAFPDGTSAPSSRTDPILTVRAATSVSSNCAFGKLTRALGEPALAEVVKRLGFDRPLDTSTSFGFGANTVSLRELAAVAATIVGDGTVKQVGLGPDWRSNGPPHGLGDDLASKVSRMSSGVVEPGGTAGGNQLAGGLVVAKTGTTDASTNAWMFGGTPELVAAVWMGNPDRPSDGMSGGAVPGYDEVHGGGLPARIWRDVLASTLAATDAQPTSATDAPRPPVIVVDPTVDCLALPGDVRPPSDEIGVPTIPTGGAVRC